MKIKNGLTTSEFWVTFLPTIIAMAVFTGFIPNTDVDIVSSLAKDIIAGIVALVSLVSYVTNRTSLKRTQMLTDYQIGLPENLEEETEPEYEEPNVLG